MLATSNVQARLPPAQFEATGGASVNPPDWRAPMRGRGGCGCGCGCATALLHAMGGASRSHAGGSAPHACVRRRRGGDDPLTVWRLRAKSERVGDQLDAESLSD